MSHDSAITAYLMFNIQFSEEGTGQISLWTGNFTTLCPVAHCLTWLIKRL